MLPWQTLWQVRDLRQPQGVTKYLKVRDCFNEMSEKRISLLTLSYQSLNTFRPTTEWAPVANEEEKIDPL